MFKKSDSILKNKLVKVQKTWIKDPRPVKRIPKIPCFDWINLCQISYVGAPDSKVLNTIENLTNFEGIVNKKMRKSPPNIHSIFFNSSF